MTVKGQVTVPKAVRDHVGLRPGDYVGFEIDTAGQVILSKPGADDRVRAALERIRRDPPITGVTTAEVMAMTREDEA